MVTFASHFKYEQLISHFVELHMSHAGLAACAHIVTSQSMRINVRSSHSARSVLHFFTHEMQRCTSQTRLTCAYLLWQTYETYHNVCNSYVKAVQKR